MPVVSAMTLGLFQRPPHVVQTTSQAQSLKFSCKPFDCVVDLVFDSYQMLTYHGCNVHVRKPQMLHANVLLPVKTNNINNEHAISFFVRTLSYWYRSNMRSNAFAMKLATIYLLFTAVVANKSRNSLKNMVQQPRPMGW